MSEVKVNKISPRTNCGTVQLGDSGDTITIPAGATITNNGTQTGFGRTGAVNWQTTKKTANFTATSGEGYFCDTAASGAFTLTLPSSPSAGDIVGLRDYNSNFATANLTIGRGGSNLMGNASDKVLNTNNLSLTLIYVDGTQGWIPVEEGTGDIGLTPTFISASGGTETTCGNFRIHTFTSPGTFTVSSLGNAPGGSDKVDYLVVAGGGGGGNYGSGGGGAGGFRTSNTVGCIPAPTMSPLANSSGLPVPATGYPITVGGGGAAGTGPNTPGGPATCAVNGQVGSNSVFSSITAARGGGGSGIQAAWAPSPLGPGGSGGGGRGGGCGAPATTPGSGYPAGNGNQPPVSPPQGNPGGKGFDGGITSTNGGGGGGAGAVGGSTCSQDTGGAGGAGSFVANKFLGGCTPAPSFGTPGPVSSTRYFAGGGGGGSDGGGSRPSTPGAGGAGGGGAGGAYPGGNGTNGTTNTGGGAGGGADGNPTSGGVGGSGIVVIRYKFQ